MFLYIFCKQIADFFCLAQLNLARTLPGSTQLEVLFIKVWLNSAQLERLLTRLSSTQEIAGSNYPYPPPALFRTAKQVSEYDFAKKYLAKYNNVSAYFSIHKESRAKQEQSTLAQVFKNNIIIRYPKEIIKME